MQLKIGNLYRCRRGKSITFHYFTNKNKNEYSATELRNYSIVKYIEINNQESVFTLVKIVLEKEKTYKTEIPIFFYNNCLYSSYQTISVIEEFIEEVKTIL